MLGLPIQLVLIAPSGQIGLTKLVDKFPTIFDSDNNVVISDECVLVGDETFRYNIAINLTEKLKAWLIELDLEYPWEN